MSPPRVHRSGVDNICRVVKVPVSVDIERGFGADPAEVARNVASLMDAGGIGVNIEDGIDPATNALRPAQIAAERIAAIRAVANTRGYRCSHGARERGAVASEGSGRRRQRRVQRLRRTKGGGAAPS